MGEKIDAESRLEQELNRRKKAEDEYRRAADDEKQALMDAAEEKMTSLRDEISQLKSDLSRVESDCYTLKEEKADAEAVLTSLTAEKDEASAQSIAMSGEVDALKAERATLQQRLDTLEEESAAFKQSVFTAKASFEAAAEAKLSDVEEQLNDALSQLAKSTNDAKLSKQTIADLNNDVEAYRKELGSISSVASNEKAMELSKLREELAQTKLDLSQSEAACLSAKHELESAKEKVDRIKKHEHEKQQKFAAKAKEAIETLKERLAKAESAQNGSGANESLQAEVKALTSTLREKDERIKKLEKSKITKSQIANIQKLKVSAYI